MTTTSRTVLPPVRLADQICGTTPGLRTGPFVYISGVTGSGPDGALVSDGAAAQARQALRNLVAALDMLGARPGDVVRTRVYLATMEDVEEVAHEHKLVFGDHLPSCGAFVQVAGLYGGARIEIECDAVVGE